ncbi:hypothetical protein MVEN_01951800 [Mycena venus]|uniref:Transmembrane protein n=1 Tax=Mycena venus TaxID=2733690 RepID=A0A8H6XGZ1_9AGAR|nr:hypothetical protein MVEN_01951800 [Mycena venus]
MDHARVPSNSSYDSHSSVDSETPAEYYKETLNDAPTTLLPSSRTEPTRSQALSSAGLRLPIHNIAFHPGRHPSGPSGRLVQRLGASIRLWSATSGYRVLRHNGSHYGIWNKCQIYSALLVFVTQTLTSRRSVRSIQTLTAVHDIATAWSGIGSAVLQLWRQMAIPGSVFGVLSALLYLGGILILHITTPALFSIQTFNSTREISVATQSLPAHKWSDDNLSDDIDNVTKYATSSLYSLPSVVESTTSLGLYGGTLYDVLQPNEATGNVTVNATGFNITCGYPNVEPNITYADIGTDSAYSVRFHGDEEYYAIFPTQIGMVVGITRDHQQPAVPSSQLLYSTVHIVDSHGTAPQIKLNPNSTAKALDLSQVSELQFMKCSQTLVPQKAVVDAQTHKIYSVEPNITKTASVWLPAPDTDTNTTSGNLLLDAWATWFQSMPPSTLPYYPLTGTFLTQYASVGELYLVRKFNLHPSELTNCSLDDSDGEFQLTNSPPVMPAQTNGLRMPFAQLTDPNPQAVPIALPGTATATQIFAQGRLDLSLIAIVAGLCVSILLTILSIPSLIPPAAVRDAGYVLIDGSGMLHAIWMFRNHHELETLLPQVEDPTTDNLRRAGMVRTRLM